MHYFYNNTITEINFTQKSKFGTFYGYQTHLKKNNASPFFLLFDWKIICYLWFWIYGYNSRFQRS